MEIAEVAEPVVIREADMIYRGSFMKAAAEPPETFRWFVRILTLFMAFRTTMPRE